MRVRSKQTASTVVITFYRRLRCSQRRRKQDHSLLSTLGDVSVGRSRCMQQSVVNTYATGVPRSQTVYAEPSVSVDSLYQTTNW